MFSWNILFSGSKCGCLTSSINISQELLEMQILRPHPDPLNLGLGPQCAFKQAVQEILVNAEVSEPLL